MRGIESTCQRVVLSNSPEALGTGMLFRISRVDTSYPCFAATITSERISAARMDKAFGSIDTDEIGYARAPCSTSCDMRIQIGRSSTNATWSVLPTTSRHSQTWELDRWRLRSRRFVRWAFA